MEEETIEIYEDNGDSGANHNQPPLLINETSTENTPLMKDQDKEVSTLSNRLVSIDLEQLKMTRWKHVGYFFAGGVVVMVVISGGIFYGLPALDVGKEVLQHLSPFVKIPVTLGGGFLGGVVSSVGKFFYNKSQIAKQIKRYWSNNNSSASLDFFESSEYPRQGSTYIKLTNLINETEKALFKHLGGNETLTYENFLRQQFEKAQRLSKELNCDLEKYQFTIPGLEQELGQTNIFGYFKYREKNKPTLLGVSRSESFSINHSSGDQEIYFGDRENKNSYETPVKFVPTQNNLDQLNSPTQQNTGLGVLNSPTEEKNTFQNQPNSGGGSNNGYSN